MNFLLLFVFLPSVLSVSCSSVTDLGATFRNNCNEICSCTQDNTGFRFTCCRERVEVTCLSSTAAQRYVNAYQAISSSSHPLYSSFIALMNRHTSATFPTIHSVQWFAHWHRDYLLELEDLLRLVDCTVTIPWYDWSKVVTTWQIQKPFIDSPMWYGDDGSGCVTNGAFASPGWSIPGGGCLTRGFNGNMPTYTQVQAVLNLSPSSFATFAMQLASLHNSPHVRIGGQMAMADSPKAPEFFLHHAMVDQMFDTWQKKSLAHLNSYFATYPNAPMPFSGNSLPSDVNDLSKQNECTCVKYTRQPSRVTGEPFLFFRCNLIIILNQTWVLDNALLKLSHLTTTQLQAIPQIPPQQPNELDVAAMREWMAQADDVQREAMARRNAQTRAFWKAWYSHINQVSPCDLPSDYYPYGINWDYVIQPVDRPTEATPANRSDHGN